MPRRALWACSKYVPWLGVLTCAQWEHHRVAVAAQWYLLQRRRSAVTAHRRRTWSRRERCSRRRRSHGVHGCADTSLLRPHGVSTVLVPRLHWVLLFPLRSHRNYEELPRHWTIALPRRSHCVHRRLPLRRCEQTQQNGIKAASSLPPPLCVQALSTSSWLLNASKPGHSLPICMSSRSWMMQTLCTSFRDECVGGPQGVG